MAAPILQHASSISSSLQVVADTPVSPSAAAVGAICSTSGGPSSPRPGPRFTVHTLLSSFHTCVEELGANLRCSICLTLFTPTSTVITPCGHSFCSSCIHAWSSSRNGAHFPCPLCKADLNRRALRPDVTTSTLMNLYFNLTQPEPPPQQQLKLCDVCRRLEAEDNLNCCSTCRISVHPACYSSSSVPTSTGWRCTPCFTQLEPPLCALCPTPTSAKRQPFHPTLCDRFTHTLCAMWMPETFYTPVAQLIQALANATVSNTTLTPITVATHVDNTRPLRAVDIMSQVDLHALLRREALHVARDRLGCSDATVKVVPSEEDVTVARRALGLDPASTLTPSHGISTGAILATLRMLRSLPSTCFVVCDVPLIHRDRCSMKCVVCGLSGAANGRCLQCDHGDCTVAFHAMCARNAKLFMKIERCRGRAGQMDVRYAAFCGKHSIAARAAHAKKVAAARGEGAAATPSTTSSGAASAAPPARHASGVSRRSSGTASGGSGRGSSSAHSRGGVRFAVDREETQREVDDDAAGHVLDDALAGTAHAAETTDGGDDTAGGDMSAAWAEDTLMPATQPVVEEDADDEEEDVEGDDDDDDEAFTPAASRQRRSSGSKSKARVRRRTSRGSAVPLPLPLTAVAVNVTPIQHGGQDEAVVLSVDADAGDVTMVDDARASTASSRSRRRSSVRSGSKRPHSRSRARPPSAAGDDDDVEVVEARASVASSKKRPRMAVTDDAPDVNEAEQHALDEDEDMPPAFADGTAVIMAVDCGRADVSSLTTSLARVKSSIRMVPPTVGAIYPATPTIPPAVTHVCMPVAAHTRVDVGSLIHTCLEGHTQAHAAGSSARVGHVSATAAAAAAAAAGDHDGDDEGRFDTGRVCAASLTQADDDAEAGANTLAHALETFHKSSASSATAAAAATTASSSAGQGPVSVFAQLHLARRRTHPYLCALLSGIHIVTCEWVHACARVRAVVHENPYMIAGDKQCGVPAVMYAGAQPLLALTHIHDAAQASSIVNLTSSVTAALLSISAPSRARAAVAAGGNARLWAGMTFICVGVWECPPSNTTHAEAEELIALGGGTCMPRGFAVDACGFTRAAASRARSSAVTPAKETPEWGALLSRMDLPTDDAGARTGTCTLRLVIVCDDASQSIPDCVLTLHARANGCVAVVNPDWLLDCASSYSILDHTAVEYMHPRAREAMNA